MTGHNILEEVSQTELNNFRIQLESIVQDINRILENNLPRDDRNDNSSNINTREECKGDNTKFININMYCVLLLYHYMSITHV